MGTLSVDVSFRHPPHFSRDSLRWVWMVFSCPRTWRGVKSVFLSGGTCVNGALFRSLCFPVLCVCYSVATLDCRGDSQCFWGSWMAVASDGDNIGLPDYVLSTAFFQAITNVKRLKPRQIEPVGWIKALATNPPLIRVGWSLRSLTLPTRLVSHGLRP